MGGVPSVGGPPFITREQTEQREQGPTLPSGGEVSWRGVRGVAWRGLDGEAGKPRLRFDGECAHLARLWCDARPGPARRVGGRRVLSGDEASATMRRFGPPAGAIRTTGAPSGVRGGTCRRTDCRWWRRGVRDDASLWSSGRRHQDDKGAVRRTRRDVSEDGLSVVGTGRPGRCVALVLRLAPSGRQGLAARGQRILSR